MRYHFTSTRLAIIYIFKKITNVVKHVEKLEPFYIAGGNKKNDAEALECLMIPQKVKHNIAI